jgi:hypothetical protein
VRCRNIASPINEASADAHEAELGTRALLQCVGTTNRAIFGDTLRIIMLWAYRRQVYGGGGHAVWLAKIMAENVGWAQSSTAPAALFFNEAALQAAEMPIHITLDDRKVEGDALLAVLHPHSEANFGRNAIRSTIHAIQEELKRANLLFHCTTDSRDDNHGFVTNMHLVLVTIAAYETVLAIKIVGVKGRMGELKAQGCNQMLSFLLALEFKVGGSSLIRPYLRPICQPKEKDSHGWWEFIACRKGSCTTLRSARKLSFALR